MKRIWFTQQKPFDYIPLRLGLGYLTAEQAGAAMKTMYPSQSNFDFAPKLYTTRTRQLSGDYYVVEGSRFKAKPVEPRIEFTAHPVATIQFADEHLTLLYRPSIEWHSPEDQIPPNLPELDLGISGVTFSHLRDELFKLNKNAALDTLFHINKLERIPDD